MYRIYREIHGSFQGDFDFSLNQRTNGPVNAHLRPEIYTCTNKLVRLEWYNACTI